MVFQLNAEHNTFHKCHPKIYIIVLVSHCVQIKKLNLSDYKISNPFTSAIRVRLHQASAIVAATLLRIKCTIFILFSYTKRQLFDDAPEWGCNPFSNVSIVFNENRISSVITELPQH